METHSIDLIASTLPDNLKEEGKKLIDAAKAQEEERLKGRSTKFRKYRNGAHEETEEGVLRRKEKANKAAFPIAVARLVMELWSPKMRQHAENLILQKAVEDNHLNKNHLKWVYVLENSEKENSSEDDWMIENIDDTIVDLIWVKFNMKEHFQQVNNHRMWIQRSFDRLKEHLPNLSPEIIERHDLSKFVFSQAVGYTLKWVHNTYHDVWRRACDLHLHNEPHHPQTWSKRYTPEEKRRKLENWLKDSCDFHAGCAYGLDLTNLDLSTEELAEPFLLESFVDMVGVEWERKKGQRLDITTRELVYMDDRFLSRYSKTQHQVIKKLIEQIIAADESWKSTVLSGREKLLMSTLPESKHPVFTCQCEIQKKYETLRMKRIVKREQEEINVEVEDIVLSHEMTNKADDNAFFIMISRVVMELWETGVRNHATKIILKKAVEEKVLSSHHIDWVLIIDKQREENKDGIITNDCGLKDEVLIKLLWNDFKLKEHYDQIVCHRHWIRQSYQRLVKFMPELTEEIIERHDLTKFALSQSIGYTLKWVHELNYPIWRKSCDVHLNYEPHHPQFWTNRHTPDAKQSCLESWLGLKGRNGVDLLFLDLTSENMAKVFLLESLVDMVAVEWERNKNQRPDLTYTELVYMEDRFLTRYSQTDKALILRLMEQIKKGDEEKE